MFDWQSVSDITVPDPKADYRTAFRIGKYRISEHAVYLDGRRYVPLAGVRRARMQSTVYTPKGCCGAGLPMTAIAIFADDPAGGSHTQPLAVLLFENSRDAETALEKITLANGTIAAEKGKSDEEPGIISQCLSG